MDATAARALLQRYLEGDITPEELALVEQWYGQMADAGEKTATGEEKQLQARMEQQLLNRIDLLPLEIPLPDQTDLSVRRRLRFAAAAILLSLAVAVWLLLRHGPQYNTVATLKGEQRTLVLPDGSKVRLNAASSITFPVVFADNKRSVHLSGEALFEVRANERQPFVVQQDDIQLQVLGTTFVITGYPDEASIKTTLLSGRLKVAKGSESSILTPGEQAVIPRGDGNIRFDRQADTGTATAWTNGFFSFRDADIGSVMRQAARWYDIDIVYETHAAKHFIADIPINTTLAEFLRLLEATGQVHFRIDGKKVIVMP